MTAASASQNPYELTSLQIAAARVQAAFRSRHRRPLRQRLREADALLDQVEHCRLEARRWVAWSTWNRVARLAREVDPSLRLRLGSDQRPDHVGRVLFALQGRLMTAASAERRRGPAAVIPLFRAP